MKTFALSVVLVLVAVVAGASFIIGPQDPGGRTPDTSCDPPAPPAGVGCPQRQAR
jgi:hypothetical protein